MSHQSGIRADDGLIASLSSERDVRAIKLKIDGEAIVLDDTMPASSTWEQDYDRCVLPFLDEHEPCYVFFRLDTKSEFAYDWIFIHWVPEDSGAREKMLYASTRATLRKQFGDNLIKEDLIGTVVSDVDLQGFKNYMLAKSAPAPLTAAEREKAALLNDKSCSGFYGPQQTVKAVAFGLTHEAVVNVQKFAAGTLNYLQLNIDFEKELISATYAADRLPPNLLAAYTPVNEGRYHLYRYTYHHNGSPCSALFFIHSISGYQSSVKSRMLYSSCKSALISQLERDFGLQFTRRLELDDMKELTAEYLLDSLHPKPATNQKLKFDKPQGPVGRRPRTQPM